MGSAASDRMCQSAIRGSTAATAPTGWVLGSPWLRSFYTVFDWGAPTTGNQVGKGASVKFASAVHQPVRNAADDSSPPPPTSRGLV